MTTSDEILAHYGVKGMKWGVIRSRASKISQRRGEKEGPSHDATQAHASKKRVKRSGTQALTNAELKQLVERMDLEQRYSKLNEKTNNRSKIKQGQDVVNQVTSTTRTLKELAQITAPVIKLGIKAAKKAA